MYQLDRSRRGRRPASGRPGSGPLTPTAEFFRGAQTIWGYLSLVLNETYFYGDPCKVCQVWNVFPTRVPQFVARRHRCVLTEASLLA